MHNRLKVRMWCPKAKKMWYQQDIVLECLTQQINFDNNSEIGIKYDHVGEEGSVFMQYTGWKDKNNKEVYAGDLLKDATGRLFIIVACEGGYHCQFVKKYEDGTYAKKECYISSYFSRDYHSVVGNIYENNVNLEV